MDDFKVILDKFDRAIAKRDYSAAKTAIDEAIEACPFPQFFGVLQHWRDLVVFEVKATQTKSTGLRALLSKKSARPTINTLDPFKSAASLYAE